MVQNLEEAIEEGVVIFINVFADLLAYARVLVRTVSCDLPRFMYTAAIWRMAHDLCLGFCSIKCIICSRCPLLATCMSQFVNIFGYHA